MNSTFSDPSRIERPGISAEWLASAAISRVSASHANLHVGYARAGILIPYYDLFGQPLMVNGRHFCRLRLDEPVDGPRYLSPAGAGCQGYLPRGLANLLQSAESLAICEGEFKAAALVEAGFAAVGIGGICACCPADATGKPAILPAISGLLKQFPGIKKLAFIGDNDTCLIPGFAREAVKLAKLSPVPVVLPRIPFDAPGKAPDDLRETWKSEFPVRWSNIVSEAQPVSEADTPGGLAFKLLMREKAALLALLSARPEAKQTLQQKCVKLVAAFHGEPLAVDDLTELLCRILGAKKNAFTSAVNKETARQAKEHAVERTLDFSQLLQSEGNDPELVFDNENYWRRMGDCWQSICREDARLHLATKFSLSLQGIGGRPSEVDQALHFAQTNFHCSYAGPLCGRRAGILSLDSGLRVLVTAGPTFIEPSPGSWVTIQKFLMNLLGLSASDPHAATQFRLCLLWLKYARLALRHPDQHLPGQVLAIVGPKDCGKSLFQDMIVTPALGGRSTNPTEYLLKETKFNEDLWGAEHLAMGDESLSENGRHRKKMRDELKKMVASSGYRLAAKYLAAEQFRAIWRVTLTGNDDPESITKLPTLDGSFDDKVIYLRAYAPPEPFPAGVQGRKAFEDAIKREMPGAARSARRARG